MQKQQFSKQTRTLAAYEIAGVIGTGDQLTLVGQDRRYHFVPSNPWIAAGWRERDEIEVDLSEVMAKKHIQYTTRGCRRIHPQDDRLELNDGDLSICITAGAVFIVMLEAAKRFVGEPASERGP